MKITINGINKHQWCNYTTNFQFITKHKHDTCWKIKVNAQWLYTGWFSKYVHPYKLVYRSMVHPHYFSIMNLFKLLLVGNK